MNEDGDRKIKTPNRGLVICGVNTPVDTSVDTDVTLFVRHGERNVDQISVSEFLSQIYGKTVKIEFLGT